MSAPILATKLYIPPPQPNVVLRPRLTGRLNEGLRLGRKLTLVSAPAGFGKTTLLSSWIHQLQTGLTNDAPIANPKSKIDNQIAWLSLDAGDNDPARFLTYLVAALRRVTPDLGAGALGMLQSPQPPPTESVLTLLLNEITTLPDHTILVLDDYHLIESPAVDQALTFLLQHLPPSLHLVIATREDPQLPLARLRARGQLTELRVTDLRFTRSEAAGFLNQVMNLDLSAQNVAALKARTEGWIAGLQLAALSMQGRDDATGFIKSFTGSHRFVLDYLVEEVLHRQPAGIQNFLLCTSILDRLCAPLCDAVCPPAARPRDVAPHDVGPASGQATLEYLERTNLFIVPLDDQRRWYRYHHLFAGFLRQRLHQRHPDRVTHLHLRASQWYAENGLEIEAFQHAVAADDVERAARLIAGEGMPLQFRGAVLPVLNWLASLPSSVLDARPSLWVMYASALSMAGQLTAVEPKLQAAEAALQNAGLVVSSAEGPVLSPAEGADDHTRNLIGHIAAIRALLAATRYQPETIIAQSQRALEYLHPDNLPVRTATIWKMGIAYHLQGDRPAARQAYSEAMSVSEASGNTIIHIAAATGLGNVQELDNQLHQAARTYRRVLQLAGDPLLPGAAEAYLGLARTSYQWNDLHAAQEHGQQSLQLSQLMENTGQTIACQVFLARLKLAQGDVTGAGAILDQADQLVRQHNFVQRLPEIVAARVLALIHQDDLAAAAHLAETHQLPLSQARVHLARGDPSAALAILGPLRQQMEHRGWQDEVLKVLVLQAVARHAQGEQDQALQRLDEALALAQPDGIIRLFLDAGPPVAQLLSVAAARGLMPDYVGQLLAAFQARHEDKTGEPVPPPTPAAQPLIEPLSPRELEVLQLVAQGLSNREIAQRLFIAVNTVKGHNRNIYGKLGVNRRTEAVARARELSLL
jgi:LuxR family maltose regulon positive regulatory protein